MTETVCVRPPVERERLSISPAPPQHRLAGPGKQKFKYTLVPSTLEKPKGSYWLLELRFLSTRWLCKLSARRPRQTRACSCMRSTSHPGASRRDLWHQAQTCTRRPARSLPAPDNYRYYRADRRRCRTHGAKRMSSWQDAAFRETSRTTLLTPVSPGQKRRHKQSRISPPPTPTKAKGAFPQPFLRGSGKFGVGRAELPTRREPGPGRSKLVPGSPLAVLGERDLPPRPAPTPGRRRGTEAAAGNPGPRPGPHPSRARRHRGPRPGPQRPRRATGPHPRGAGRLPLPARADMGAPLPRLCQRLPPTGPPPGCPPRRLSATPARPAPAASPAAPYPLAVGGVGGAAAGATRVVSGSAWGSPNGVLRAGSAQPPRGGDVTARGHGASA